MWSRAARRASRSCALRRRAARRARSRAPPRPAPRARRGPTFGTAARSPPLPHRLPLVEEGLHALLDVLGREGDRELRAQEVERVGERHVLGAEHRVLAHAHEDGRLCGEGRRPPAPGGRDPPRGGGGGGGPPPPRPPPPP